MVYRPGATADEPAFARLECIFEHHRWFARGRADDVRISVRVCPPDRDSSMFPWHTFLSRWDWGQDLLREGITSFIITSDEVGPIIEVTTRSALRVISFRSGWSQLTIVL